METIYISDSLDKMDEKYSSLFLPYNHCQEFLNNDNSVEVINNMLDFNDCTNLICTGPCCNIGIIKAAFSNDINKLVLISPELFNPSSLEKCKIMHLRKINNNFGEEIENRKIIINKKRTANYLIFDKTLHLARYSIDKIECPTLIIFSKGDYLISHIYFKKISKKNNIDLIEVDSCMHNPLYSSEREKTISNIQKFVK